MSVPMHNAYAVFPPLVDRVVVITGATASGKSAIGTALAQRLGGEILSLDSIAVYQEMNIGTAKPSPDQQSQVPHHLIDLVSPDQSFSVVSYLQAAHAAVAEIWGRGHVPIFVGGTPMFLKAILRGFDSGPPADIAFRESVEKDLEKFGAESLRTRLQQVDPLAAHRIDANDTRRMIRALEVAFATGKPLSHRQLQFDQSRPADKCNVFQIAWPRAELHRRINKRVDEMWDVGLVDEVIGLVKKYKTLSKTASQAVGYRELIELIGSPQTLEDSEKLGKTKELIATHTRQMAKRQETWFRSFTEVRPVTVHAPLDASKIAAEIEVKLTEMPPAKPQ